MGLVEIESLICANVTIGQQSDRKITVFPHQQINNHMKEGKIPIQFDNLMNLFSIFFSSMISNRCEWQKAENMIVCQAQSF